jgi:hypothetical protein
MSVQSSLSAGLGRRLRDVMITGADAARRVKRRLRPSHRRPRRDPGDRLFLEAPSALMSAWRVGGATRIISLLLGGMTWGGLYGRDPRIRAFLPLIR